MIIFFVFIVEVIHSAPLNAEAHHRILNMEKSSKPIQFQNTILFSYKARKKIHSVSIAFEHDQFRRLYPSQKNLHDVFITSLPIPTGITTLRYRLIVDGLWTLDPHAETETNNHGIPVSILKLPKASTMPATGVNRLSDGTLQFVYKGEQGSNVSVMGDFNNWDPFLISMKESLLYPGYYSIIVDIPRTARFYRYTVNGEEMLDPANEMVLINGWGERASMLPP